MSLDIYLTLLIPDDERQTETARIFVRENGGIRELSRDEWDARFPGSEPVTFTDDDPGSFRTVFEYNITHNLNRMAEAAGVYKHLWRPDELGITRASQLIEPLSEGLKRLESEPEKYEAFNPENGWGNYEGLVHFVRQYLSACTEHPKSFVRVSR